mmetsp:Transcript_29423/g.61300  ORF Transcript_29423/g.61300 Transcript_29423/m.61300 type:complete len:582 (-) Transcript_29423:761-2506(-)
MNYAASNKNQSGYQTGVFVVVVVVVVKLVAAFGCGSVARCFECPRFAIQRFRFLHEAGNEPVGDQPLVFLPVVSVLFGAQLVVPDRPVHQQDEKVERVVVGNDRVESAQEAVGESHQVVPRVVDLAGRPPPAARQQPRPALGGKVGQVGDALVARIVPEYVLLAIRQPKDGESQAVEGQYSHQHRFRQPRVVVDEKLGRVVVGKGDPRQVTKDQHEAKAVRGDVHGGEDALFHEHRIPDVDGVEEVEQDHAAGDASGQLPLFLGTGHVQEDPEYQAGAKLTEFLPIEGPAQGARVEFPSHEKIVDVVPRSPGVRENPLGSRHRILPEARNVQPSRQGKTEEDVDKGQSLVVAVEVVVERKPRRHQEDYHRPKGRVAVHFVFQPERRLVLRGRVVVGLGVDDDGPLDPLSRQDLPQQDQSGKPSQQSQAAPSQHHQRLVATEDRGLALFDDPRKIEVQVADPGPVCQDHDQDGERDDGAKGTYGSTEFRGGAPVGLGGHGGNRSANSASSSASSGNYWFSKLAMGVAVCGVGCEEPCFGINAHWCNSNSNNNYNKTNNAGAKRDAPGNLALPAHRVFVVIGQ